MNQPAQAGGGRWRWLSGGRQRRQEEVILMLLCALSIPSILPFGVYRLLQGSWASAAVDMALVIGMLAVIVHVWRTGRYQVASIGVTIFYSAGMLVTVYLRGVALVYWVYPTMIAAYFVLRPTLALAINSVGLAVLVTILVSRLEVVNLLTIVVTIGLVNLFAYIFAYRTGLQNKELHTAVELDFLTGVGNRRALERKLAEHAQERRPQLEASLLLLDLDHFKQVNDQYGHAAGDKVLIRLAELMRRHTRSSDRIFRYGGEEFAILASGAGLSAAARLAEGLRTAVAAATLLEGHPITISIGVAYMDQASEPAEWLEQADKMLYAAKQGGRNAVRVAQTATEAAT
ncbi:diguanylate cyclase (GGDEF) domain-containing protein [Duganella sp. CF402]|uniref:GGDEF domain-containing protein n=1 Tax=unclassified Duganella TaxID=2636909 RepID=UPI0008CC9FF8|nr:MULTISPECIES: GGDEF domain-containing protein [unclassified Duganella]RZT09826.1 diguanylate cyclase (GGDEF)-like protein [Duganella sp. BK701]SEL41251.1 diguanylate cyclase (GGDEF) domain-containing protein [Duganella sp. CF402]